MSDLSEPWVDVFDFMRKISCKVCKLVQHSRFHGTVKLSGSIQNIPPGVFAIAPIPVGRRSVSNWPDMQSSSEPTQYLSIHTPTELDLRELFTLGLTSKRDGTKIGHKGSGLKFALALIHRLGSHLVVRVGPHDLKSVAMAESIRGQEHRIIRLEGKSAGRPARIETHITVRAGADTWTEPWFALRELVQNALDEGGTWELGSDQG